MRAGHNFAARPAFWPTVVRPMDMAAGFDLMDLISGHTHNQMDQYFSRLSNHLGRLQPGVYDFAELETAITECWKTNNIIKNDISMETETAKRDVMIPVARRFEQMVAVSRWGKNYHYYNRYQ